MKPHRRKPTPPRREDGSPQGGEEAHDESVAPEEQYYVPEETVAYDPVASLVDENQAYGEGAYEQADPNLVYDETQQAYVDPGQAYYDPNQAYYDPNQAYVDPNAVYDETQQAYVDPNQAHYDPNQAYYDPNQAYVEPNQAYAEPDPGYASGGVYDEAPEPSYQAPPPPPPPAVKKKVTSRAPQRRPSTPPRKVPGGGYSRPRPTYNTGGGLSFMTVFLTLVAMGMLAVVVLVVLPRDMSSVTGYPVNPLTSGKPRNLLAEAQKEMVSRTADLSFTEEEVNQYLNHRLQAEQTGPMAALVKFRGVYIDFTPGIADIIIERELFGMPLTMGATIETDKFRQQTIYRATNWHLGRIDLGKRNIKPVIELFLRLRMSCLDEYQTLQQMVDVKFEENKVILDSTL